MRFAQCPGIQANKQDFASILQLCRSSVEVLSVLNWPFTCFTAFSAEPFARLSPTGASLGTHSTPGKHSETLSFNRLMAGSLSLFIKILLYPCSWIAPATHATAYCDVLESKQVEKYALLFLSFTTMCGAVSLSSPMKLAQSHPLGPPSAACAAALHLALLHSAYTTTCTARVQETRALHAPPC